MYKIKMSDKGKSWLLLSLAFSFMLCVFAPLEAYFANQAEFWFGLSQILPVLLVVFVMVNLLFYLMYRFVQKIKYMVWVYGLLLCILVYFYIQGNYVPRNYGVLNGVEVEWNSYISYAITSIVLLVMSFVAWVVSVWKVKEKIYSVGKVICSVLMLIQIITLGTLCIQNLLVREEDSDDMIVTTNGIFELSKDNNIVVFVLDTFDSLIMQDMLEGENGEKYKKLFENFTYYSDTLSKLNDKLKETTELMSH